MFSWSIGTHVCRRALDRARRTALGACVYETTAKTERSVDEHENDTESEKKSYENIINNIPTSFGDSDGGVVN